MSLQRCEATGARLPDTATCGVLCADFPTCLPRPSPTLLADVAAFSLSAGDDLNAITDVLATLHDAITEGLGRTTTEE